MSPPRLIVMAKPPSAVLESLKRVIQSHGLDKRLGPAIFDPGNWHQTLSSRYADCPEIRDALRRACAKVSAERFTLTLDRITGTSSRIDNIHWTFYAPGTSKGLAALLAAIRAALLTEGIRDNGGHRPHITISYRAPTPLASLSFTPVVWPIDEFLLVRGGGTPYRYEELCRWPLTSKIESAGHQLSLFS